MSTETDTKLDADAPPCWPPVAHLTPKTAQPCKPGDRALCGAKLMGIDLENAHVDQVCKKCIEIALRQSSG